MRARERNQSSRASASTRRRLSRGVDRVPSVFVETSLARRDAAERPARERRARSAADELTREGRPVRFHSLVHIPEDEICFVVFDAPSGPDAAHAARQAGLDSFLVVEAVSSRKEHHACDA
jgi:hypothetical protein